ncbi:MAG: proline dehydrogenase family protein [Halodesulfurarchaeum sp.]
MIPPVADRFVAGETPQSALRHTDSLSRDGIGAILNLLGEHYTDSSRARADRESYRTVLDEIARTGRSVGISVKPSQLGVLIGESTFRENLRAVVSTANSHSLPVWIDMEDHTTTDATLDAYVDLVTEFDGGLGVCLQSNLERTRDDLERVSGLPGAIRLVKGAYDEPRNIAYRRPERVNEQFTSHLEYLFEEGDTGIAIGTHDPAMIDFALSRQEEYGTPVEFQFLMGVREDEQRRLAEQGIDVVQYVPYGSKWASYFYRRLRERKQNVLFALRAVLDFS